MKTKKIVKVESIGIQKVFSTNVEDNHNYITSNGIVNKNCVIDSDYRGEIHAHLMNHSGRVQKFNAGDKVIQGMIFPVWTGSPVEVNEVNENTERGAGGFGSTGK